MNDNVTIAKQDLGMLPHQVKVHRLQEFLKSLPQASIPVTHWLGYGIYTRVIHIPADTIVIGKEHLQGQHNFLMEGEIEIIDGDTRTRFIAPEILVTGPGTKRVARTVTDVMWATSIATDLTDIDEIERQFIHPRDCTAPPRIEHDKGDV
jgi:hypothetical protein